MDSDRGSQSPASIIDENEESIILVPLSKPGSRTSEGSHSSARKSDSGKNDSVSDNDIVNLTRAEKRDLLACRNSANARYLQVATSTAR